MEVTLKLDAQVAADYAEYYGFVDDGAVTTQEYVTVKIMERIQNDVTEHANRKALSTVTPILDVTSDGSQTTLKADMDAKLAAKRAEQTKSEPAGPKAVTGVEV